MFTNFTIQRDGIVFSPKQDILQYYCCVYDVPFLGRELLMAILSASPLSMPEHPRPSSLKISVAVKIEVYGILKLVLGHPAVSTYK
jgi:hypothetical protein